MDLICDNCHRRYRWPSEPSVCSCGSTEFHLQLTFDTMKRTEETDERLEG